MSQNQGIVITLEREVVSHTYSFYATSSQVHKSLIKAILTGSLYVERAKAGADFDLVGVRQLPKRHGGVDDGEWNIAVLDGFVDYEKHSLHGISLGILPILPSSIMVNFYASRCQWSTKLVHMEIKGELSDEVNVADPCKGAVSFEYAMFEKRGRSIGA
ncbi:hypothetical protein Tco_0300044 [Tanacetum coccineum]